jgi:hypothetical protein
VDPTPLAYLALLGWPWLALLLFVRLPPAAATVCVILGGELLLPELLSFDFPGIPPLDRTSISCLSALLGCLLLHHGRLRRPLPGTGIEALALVLVAGSFLTAVTNRDLVLVGGAVVPGMSLYDGLSSAAGILITVWTPFFLGRALFRRPEDLRTLFGLLVAAMLAYSPLVLFELRMSPQLHRLVYGYHQHEFFQTVRGGGWRPMVFTTHGLTLAQFVFFAAAAAVGLWRVRVRAMGLPSGAAGAYLSLLLVALKSLAAALYGALVLPLIALLRPAWQLRLAALLALAVLAYPLLRGGDAFPTGALLEAASRVSVERRQSLEFRFQNEERLLAHARERLWLGWGTFGRHRVRDPLTGEDTSVTDGYWIIALSSQGILGLVATFGLLLAPILAANLAVRRWRSARDRLLVAVLAWLVAISGVNLLPNADFSPFVLLLGGALAGVCEASRAASARRSRRGLAE